jgi:hypothetical protein
MSTSNIPKSLPIKCDKYTHGQIMEWISSRPDNELDQCVNRHCRWVYTVSDHGIFTDTWVLDAGTGEKFHVEVDVDSL